MRIAIIADIHDNLVNLEKCLKWGKENEIAELICCGDVTNGETLGFLAENFSGKIRLVRGNMDIYDEAEVKDHPNIIYYGRTGRARIGRFDAGFCHEPFLIGEVLKKGRCGIVFYGHTHKPWIKEEDGVITANPGTLGAVFQKATFAVWDAETAKIELKILEAL